MRTALIDRYNQLRERTIEGVYNALNWQVEKLPLITIEGDQTGTFATLRRHDNGSKTLLADKLSDRYNILQNFDMVTSLVLPLVEQGATPRTAYAFDGGKRVSVTLDLPGQTVVQKANAKVGDVISQHLNVTNWHDGASTWKVQIGTVRLRCTNGMTATDHDIVASGRHSSKLNVQLLDAQLVIAEATRGFERHAQALNRLANSGTTVDRPLVDRVVQEVYVPDYEQIRARATGINIPAADKEKLEKAQTRLSQIRQEIWREFNRNETITQDENARGTLYGLYQAINWEINHGGSASDSRLQSLLYGAGRDRDLLALERTLAIA